MTTSARSSFDSLVAIVYLVCSILFIAALVYHHFQLILYPAPLDLNEGAQVSTTALFASGGSPYSLASQPVRMMVYTPAFNVFVAPFTFLFENSLTLHRVLNGLFLCLTLALFVLVYRRAADGAGYSLSVFGLVYAGFLYYSTPIASPNGLGLFLFFLAIFVPWLKKFSTTSLAFSIVLGILAFYTKQYFIACIGYVALYLFVAVSKKKGVIYFLAAFFTLISSLVVLQAKWPFFLDNTVWSNVTVLEMVSSWKTLHAQILEYAVVNSPYLLLLAVCLFSAWRTKSHGAIKVPESIGAGERAGKYAIDIDLLDFEQPLLRQAPSVFWVGFTASLVVVFLVLGRNPGNHLTYFFQIVSPFLHVGLLLLASRFIALTSLTKLLLIGLFATHYSVLSHDFSYDKESWAKLRTIVSSAENVYATPWLEEEMIKQDKPMFLNAATLYFQFSTSAPAWLEEGQVNERNHTIWQQYLDGLEDKIARAEFDAIVVDPLIGIPPREFSDTPRNLNKLLRKHYRRTDVIKMKMTDRNAGGEWRISVWKPKENNQK